MKIRFVALPLTLASFMPAVAQQEAPAQKSDDAYTLKTQANVVLVPSTVRTKQGETIYTLRADQFVVEDNGVAQAVRLDEDTDSLGLTLVVLVQCSRSAVMEYAKLTGLPSMLDDLAGGAPRQVAIATYGKEPTLLGDFSADPHETISAINQIEPCDGSDAATLDAVAWASSLLDERKDQNRHVILLISETRDHGSHKKPADGIASLGRTNTVVDSISFSPGKNEIFGDLLWRRLRPLRPSGHGRECGEEKRSTCTGRAVRRRVHQLHHAKKLRRRNPSAVESNPQLLSAQLPAAARSQRRTCGRSA